MGTIKNGILGGFSGKVGSVVGSTWKGINVIKSAPGKRTGTPSAKQLAQQSKFRVVIKFLRTFSALLAVTFRGYTSGESGINAAFSYNYHNAVTGVYPDLSIDYSKVLVSRGNLSNVTDPKVAAGLAGKLNFSWTNNGGTGNVSDSDQAVLVAYCPATKQSVYSLDSALRKAGTAILDVTVFSGQPVETWLAFITTDGNEVSDSYYAGTVTVL